MMITDLSKRVIPFRKHDAKHVGDGCFYIDQIIWLNSSTIEMGDEVKFNYGCWVNGFGGLTIGDGTIFGPRVMLYTANHITDDLDHSMADQGWKTQPVHIGKNCWFGMGVLILPGVTIGDGAIVGAGSVVTKDLEPMSVSVGNPAKTIKYRDR